MEKEIRPHTHIEESELIRQRMSKLESIFSDGISAYGGRFETSSLIGDLKSNFSEGVTVSVAGRIMAARAHGKSAFYDLKD